MIMKGMATVQTHLIFTSLKLHFNSINSIIPVDVTDTRKTFFKFTAGIRPF